MQKPPEREIVYVERPSSGVSGGAAALLSFLIPGLGQMCQGRAIIGIFSLVVTVGGYLLFILPGLIMHLIVIVDAAQWVPRSQRPPRRRDKLAKWAWAKVTGRV